jgi:hypothetical protein
VRTTPICSKPHSSNRCSAAMPSNTARRCAGPRSELASRGRPGSGDRRSEVGPTALG